MKGGRILLQLLVLVAVLVLAWGLANPRQRSVALEALGVTQIPDGAMQWQLEVDYGPLARWLASVSATATPAAPPTVTATTTTLSESPVTEDSAPGPTSALGALVGQAYLHGLLPAGEGCGKTRSRALTDVEVPVIYHWKDAQGRTHFSDQRANADARFVGEQYAQAQRRFRIEVTFEGMARNGALEDQLRKAAVRAYDALAGLIEPELQRQINLQVRLYATRAAYEAQHRQRFPDMNAQAFFSAADNSIYLVNEGDTAQLLAVASHEATHAILAGITGPLPVWLNEGLAQAAERGFTLPAQIPLDLSEADVRRVLEASAQTFYGAQAPANYQAAAKLVLYLRADPRGREFLASTLNQLARAPCQPLDVMQALEARVGSPAYLALLL